MYQEREFFKAWGHQLLQGSKFSGPAAERPNDASRCEAVITRASLSAVVLSLFEHKRLNIHCPSSLLIVHSFALGAYQYHNPDTLRGDPHAGNLGIRGVIRHVHRTGLNRPCFD
jgi:hypothetical protein